MLIIFHNFKITMWYFDCFTHKEIKKQALITNNSTYVSNKLVLNKPYMFYVHVIRKDILTCFGIFEVPSKFLYQLNMYWILSEIPANNKQVAFVRFIYEKKSFVRIARSHCHI